MRPVRALAGALGTAALLVAVSAGAVGLAVEGGASVALGTGTLDLGCTDLSVAGTFAGGSGLVQDARDVAIQPGGTLDAGSATLRVAGDWSNSGSFSSGTSAVGFVDGCGRSSAAISGDSSFFDLDLTSSIGKLFALASGSTQAVTSSLVLAGSSGSLLRIDSSVDGSEAYLDVTGSQSVAYVEVEDNHASGDPIVVDGTSSLLGNTLGWFYAMEIPALGATGLALLAALLLAATAARARRTRTD